MSNIGKLLKAGEASGDFRAGVNPVDLHISISALAYHYISNRYTLSYLLDRKLSAEGEMQARIQHIEELTLLLALRRVRIAALSFDPQPA